MIDKATLPLMSDLFLLETKWLTSLLVSKLTTSTSG